MTDLNAKVTGVGDASRVLAGLPRQVEDQAAKAAEKLAGVMAPRISQRATSAGRLASRVGRNVRARGAQLEVAGSVNVGGRNVDVGQLFYGANWGGGGRVSTRQFQPFRPGDRWFFTQIREDNERIAAGWDAAFDAAHDDWER